MTRSRLLNSAAWVLPWRGETDRPIRVEAPSGTSVTVQDPVAIHGRELLEALERRKRRMEWAMIYGLPMAEAFK